MPIIHNQKGVSLVELVIGGFFIATIVASLSVSFPKASQNVALTQQRNMATSLAQSQLQVLKSTPYSYMDVTDANPSVGQFNALCDCSIVPDLTVLPSTSTVLAGTMFKTAACVHYVSPASPWTSQCLGAGDSGYKHLVVYVYWNNGSQQYSTYQESLMIPS